MPDSCCSTDYDRAFDARTAHRQLTAYRRNGASGSTARLVEAIRATGVDDASVLDIGGGIGVIGLELLNVGAASLVAVDASRAYVAVARRELERRGLADRATVHHGDYVSVAADVEPADIVTLDRVVCCYADWRALVDASASRARRLYGLVYPNERWWIRLALLLANLGLRLSGTSFRGHVHPERRIDERVRRAGFRPRLHHRGWVWQTVVYERVP